jgi:hypothetical protein
MVKLVNYYHLKILKTMLQNLNKYYTALKQMFEPQNLFFSIVSEVGSGNGM